MTRHLAAAALALIVLHPGVSSSQSNDSRVPSLELRIPGGALVATGAQRDLQKNGQVTAAQLTWVVTPRLAVTGTVAWARSRDIAAPGTPKLDVFMYDAGVELRSAERHADNGVSLRTFAGVGAGARSYNSRALNVGATHHVAGYAAVGGEVGMRRVGLRLEVRDYATGMRPGAGRERSGAGNDLVVMASLRLNRRASASRQ
ncbi:MAG: hypothetical protein ACLGIK_06365 [Gemmatimonadota bacterium]